MHDDCRGEMDGIGVQNWHGFSIEKFGSSEESERARGNAAGWRDQAWDVRGAADNLPVRAGFGLY